MKFVLKCDAESNTILPRPLEIKTPFRLFLIDLNDEGVVNGIKVTADVPDPSRFQWGLEPVPEPHDPSAAPYVVHAIYDPDLYSSMVSDIQCLEATLGLMFGLRKVHWEHPTISVIFEAEAECRPGWEGLASVKAGRGPVAPVKPEPQAFAAVATLSFNYRSIVVAQSFWRQGESDLDEGKFINAFFNYYFVLEGLYGNGKTKNHQVLEEFKKSGELRESIERHLSEKQPMQFIHQVKAMLDGRKKRPDHDGFLSLLVWTRGDLHHFVNNPNRAAGSPLTHDDYEGIAMLARYLSRRSLMLQMEKLNRQANPGSYTTISANYC
jgi:hypothetical protein